MTTIKELIGVASVVLTLAAYIPYFFKIIRGKTKPHAFSWFIWFLLTLIGFLIQVTNGAGPGAWMLGFTALACLLFSVVGFTKGRENITSSDWVSFSGAIVALVFWIGFNASTFSVILITLADLLGFYPTVRKSIKHPYQETLVTYFFSSVKTLLSLLALQTYSFATAFYLAYLLIANAGFVIFLSIKRSRAKPHN